MHHHQVLVRTAKGQEEVRTLVSTLPPAQRRLLILIDEHDTVDETLRRFAVLGDDIETHLETLLAEGFLAPRPAVCEACGLTADQWELFAAGLLDPWEVHPAGDPRHDEPIFNLEKAKDFARVTVLESLCPPDGHVERIEAAQTVGELRVELDALRESLPKLLPQRQAEQIWARLEPLMLPLSPDQILAIDPDAAARALVLAGGDDGHSGRLGVRATIRVPAHDQEQRGKADHIGQGHMPTGTHPVCRRLGLRVQVGDGHPGG